MFFLCPAQDETYRRRPPTDSALHARCTAWRCDDREGGGRVGDLSRVVSYCALSSSGYIGPGRVLTSKGGCCRLCAKASTRACASGRILDSRFVPFPFSPSLPIY